MLYKSWKTKLVRSKEEFVCIIHNKMDHSQIAKQKLEVKNKMMTGLGQLPITLTWMIVHRHGDEAYAQYSNELWPNNLNFTIGLILCLWRTLEKELVRDSQKLFEEEFSDWIFFTINVRELLTHENIEGPRTICWCKTFAMKIVASNGQLCEK